MSVTRLAIIATHPIQYHIPWYRLLAKQEGLELTVYYALLPDEQQQGTGFGISFAWDIPLMEGYTWKALANKAGSPGLRGFFSSSTPGIHKVLAASRPDVVIITGWQSLPLVQALWACLRLRIPRIIRGESNALRERPWWIKLVHRGLVSRFNAFLAIGKANREFYRRYGIEERDIFQCRYFVDNARFQAQYTDIADQREKLRASWRIPSGSVCFLYAGKLEPKKRIMDLLRAIAGASRVSASIHLLVAGTGELEEAAATFVKERNLPVTFAGFLNQSEIVRAYVVADCLVLPSDYGETWGLVVNEAMVCGLPAVVSDRVGSGPDLVEEGETGAIFPFGNTGVLTEKLLALAADRKNLARMGQQARQRVREYSVEAAVDGTFQAIRAVTKKSPKY